jgi:hypothetical protein
MKFHDTGIKKGYWAIPEIADWTVRNKFGTVHSK